MNPQKAPQSLTSEELDALLFRPAETQLAPSASSELASLRSVLSDFRAVSIAAADHHRRHASIAPAKSRAMSAMWVFAAAAYVLCAVIPAAFHRHPTSISMVAASTSQPISTVSDEVLLADVQADLDASVPSALLPLAPNVTTSKSTTQRNR